MRTKATLMAAAMLTTGCDHLCPPYGNNPECDFYDATDTEGPPEGLPQYPDGVHPCQIAAETWAQDVGPVHWTSRAWVGDTPSDVYETPNEPGPSMEAVFDAFASAWNLPPVFGVSSAPAWLVDPGDIFVPGGPSKYEPADRFVMWVVVDPTAATEWTAYLSSGTVNPMTGGPGGEYFSFTPAAQVGDAVIAVATKTGPGSAIVPSQIRGSWSWSLAPAGPQNEYGPQLGRIAGVMTDDGEHVGAKVGGNPGAGVQPVTEGGWGWGPQGGVCVLSKYPEGSLDGGETGDAAPLVPESEYCDMFDPPGCKTVETLTPWGSYKTCRCS